MKNDIVNIGAISKVVSVFTSDSPDAPYWLICHIRHEARIVVPNQHLRHSDRDWCYHLDVKIVMGELRRFTEASPKDCEVRRR